MMASWGDVVRGGRGGGGGSCSDVRWKDLGSACGVGLVAFPTTLALLQRVVLVPLRIRAHHRVLGTAAGLAAVSAAGLAATAASSAAFEYAPAFRREVLDPAPDRGSRLMQWAKAAAEDTLSACSRLPQTVPAKLEAYRSLAHLALDEPRLFAEEITSSRGFKFATVVSLSTLGSFFLLGGRPRRVVPSCLWHRGAFACEGLPARSADHATQAEHALLTSMGRSYGCHSCGTRRAASFFGDHIPPSKLANARPQRFLPQCGRCSSMQGASLRNMTKRAITHGVSLRLYHFWIPLPWFLSFVLLKGAPAAAPAGEEGQASILDAVSGLFSSSASPSSPAEQFSAPPLPPSPLSPTLEAFMDSRGSSRTEPATPTWGQIVSRLGGLGQHVALFFFIYLLYLELVARAYARQFEAKLHEMLRPQDSNEAISAGLRSTSNQPALPTTAPPAAPPAGAPELGGRGLEPAPHAGSTVGLTDAVRAAFTGGRGAGEEGDGAGSGGGTDKEQQQLQQQRSWWRWRANTAETGAQGTGHGSRRSRSDGGGVGQLFPTEEVVLSVQHTLLPSDTRGLHRGPREPLLTAQQHMAEALRRVRKEGRRPGDNQQRAEELLEDDLAMLGVEIRLLREEEE